MWVLKILEVASVREYRFNLGSITHWLLSFRPTLCKPQFLHLSIVGKHLTV